MKKQKTHLPFVGCGFMSPEIGHLEPSYGLKEKKGKTKNQSISDRINQSQINYKRYLFEDVIEDPAVRWPGRLKEIMNSSTSYNDRCYTKKNICADFGY